MVTHGNQDTRSRRSPQGSEGPTPEPNKINSSTPYDFNGKNLTPYGGLLPVIDRKSTRLNSSHLVISYAVFCLKKKTKKTKHKTANQENQVDFVSLADSKSY